MELTTQSFRIGIIGGGQLARMSTQAAQQLGYQVVILDSDRNSPAAQVTPFRVDQEWHSISGVQELADQTPVITLENEWVSPNTLQAAEKIGAKVFPSSMTMLAIGDKLNQRQCLASHGLPSHRFAPISSWLDARLIADSWGTKVVLKSRLGGYDGNGVVVVREPRDWDKVSGYDAAEWYIEEHISFNRELAVMVSRNSSGQVAQFTAVESRQTIDGNRCDIVIAPAEDPDGSIVPFAASIAKKVVTAIDGVGIFGVELFQRGLELFVNEVAPRPHNSGHWTMDGAATSQFEQHIRSICDLPPGPTKMIADVVVMANLLAPRDGKLNIEDALRSALTVCPAAHIHWYGKCEMRTGRKMGHINILGSSRSETLKVALAARSAFWKGSQ